MHNRCYGVILKYDSRRVYCPLNHSTYPDIDISYDVRDFVNKYDDTLQIIKDFELKIIKPIIRIEDETNTYQIGLIIEDENKNKLYIYHEPFTNNEILNVENIKIISNNGDTTTSLSNVLSYNLKPTEILPYENFPYDPREIDQLIIDYTKNDIQIPEDLTINYNNKLYTLFLIEFANIINKNKNDALRRKIKEIITSFDIKNAAKIKEQIIALNLEYNDLQIIKDIIKVCYGDKSKALKIIDETKFEFDNYIINNIKKMPKAAQIQELTKLMNKVCEFVKSDNIEVFNIFVSCSKEPKQTFCANGKLKITEKLFHAYCELLYVDINDHNKNILLLTTSGILNPYEFIIRPTEKLY